MKLILLAAAAAAVGVDEAEGIIRGVSVITSGVEAIGHGWFVDDTTLAQVLACCQQFPGGRVAVKANHGSGIDGIVGAVTNFRIDGGQLRGDLHLLKSHPRYAALLELAKVQPSTFGLSIAFSGTPESKAGKDYIRCSEIYSVDLVDAPAANPSGLFSAAPRSALEAIRGEVRREENELSELRLQLRRKDLSPEERHRVALRCRELRGHKNLFSRGSPRDV